MIPSPDDIEHFLVTESASRALVGGLLVSWLGTQWIKRWLLPVMPFDTSEEFQRFLLVALAFALGFFGTLNLGGGGFLAVLVGVASPTLYTYVMRTLYHFWPFLEDKMSAQPKVKVREDGMVGIKEGDDKTRWIEPE